MSFLNLKKIKFVLFVYTLLLFFVPFEVFGFGGATGGSGGSIGGCGGCACISGRALRFSLYEYSPGGKAVKNGHSFDVWDGTVGNPDNSFVNGAFTDPSSNCSDPINNKHDGKTHPDKKCFSLTRDKYKNKGSYVVKKDFKYDYTGNSENFIKYDLESEKGLINTYFGTEELIKKNLGATITNTETTYLVVETLFRMSNICASNWVPTNKEYIGTAYEVFNIYNYSPFVELFASSITTAAGNKLDKNLNLRKIVYESGAYLKPAKSGATVSALSNRTYGMAIYSLDTIIPPPANVCNCTSAKNKYLCAMNYCDANGGTDRINCVTSICGVPDPGFSECSKEADSPASETNCSATTSAKYSTCTKANSNTYYRTSCTENNKITYNDSLPTTILPGTGFSYSLALSGNKTCTTSFDVNKWNFDYAVASNSTRAGMESNLANYNSNIGITNATHQYDSSKSTASINIKEGSKNANLDLINYNNSGDGSHVRVSNGSIDATVIEDGDENKEINKNRIIVRKNQSTVKYKTTISHKILTSGTMSSIYSIKDVCVDNGTGNVYNARYDEISKKYTCNKIDDKTYAKYFTNKKTASGKYDTVVTLTKSGTNVSGIKNNCYYKLVKEPFTCKITKDGNKYSLHVVSDYKIDYTKLRYTFSQNVNDSNWSTVASSSKILANDIIFDTSKTVYGKIKYEDSSDPAVTCTYAPSVDIPSGERCTEKYEPTDYDEIADYCKEHWKTDKANYTSEKSCYESCTGQSSSCKVKFSCDETANIENYCAEKYDKVTATNDYMACINDCSCSDSEGKAVYRPISLNNPFPDRLPGANWVGYSDKSSTSYKDLMKKTIDKVGSGKADYVIELTAEDIKSINENTKSYRASHEGKDIYTEYIQSSSDKTPKDGTNRYRSKFIYDEFSNLFCIKNGQGSCK